MSERSRRLWFFYSSNQPRPAADKEKSDTKKAEQKPGSGDDNANQAKS